MARFARYSFFIACILWLLVACRIQNELATTAPDVKTVMTSAAGTAYAHFTETVIASLPVSYATSTSLPIQQVPEAMAALLLSECEQSSEINANNYFYWQSLPKQYGMWGCKFPIFSPDEKYLAYVVLGPHESGKDVYFVDSVRVLEIATQKSSEVHVAHKLDYIVTLEWGPTGELIIGESVWEGPQVIFIYDLSQGVVLSKMRTNQDGILHWNITRTAFYVSRIYDGYGADACVGELGGYYFLYGERFPDLYDVFNIEKTENDPFDISYGKKDNLFIEPFGWSQDGKRLWLMITILEWDAKNNRYLVGPRQVGTLEFSAQGVHYTQLASNPYLDYSLDGLPEPAIISKVYEPHFCP